MSDLRSSTISIKRLGAEPDVFEPWLDPNGFLPYSATQLHRLLSGNPDAQEDDPALTLVLDGKRIVGRLGYLGTLVRMEGKLHRILGLDGFFLDPEYKETGAGGVLILGALATRRGLVASGGPSLETQHLYRKVGFKELAPLRRFLFVNHLRVGAEYLMGSKPWVRGGARLLQPLVRTWRSLLIWRHGKKGGLSWTPIHRLPEEIDQIEPCEGANRFPLTSARLNWAIGHREIRAMEIRDGARLLGYFLLRISETAANTKMSLPAMKVGSLLDYSFEETAGSVEAKQALMAHALALTRDLGLDVLEFQHGDPELASICRRMGMVEKGGNKVFLRPPRGIRIDPEARWHLTHGISDVLIA